MPGFIYFIEAPDEGLTRIGFSAADPISRFLSHNASSPKKLTPIGFVRGGRDLEGRLHDKYESWHSHSEWFRTTLGLVRYVNRKATPWTVLIDPNAAGGPVAWNPRRYIIPHTMINGLMGWAIKYKPTTEEECTRLWALLMRRGDIPCPGPTLEFRVVKLLLNIRFSLRRHGYNVAVIRERLKLDGNAALALCVLSLRAEKMLNDLPY